MFPISCRPDKQWPLRHQRVNLWPEVDVPPIKKEHVELLQAV